MKKIFVVFILIFFIIVLALWLFKAPAMSMYLSKKLKMPISVEGVELSKSQLKLKNLKIRNPSVFKRGAAYICSEVLISYSLNSLKNEPLVIDKIDLNDSYLYIDCKNALCNSNNWTQIMKDVSDKELKNPDGKEVIVSKLSMNRLNVEIKGFGFIPGIKKNVNIEHIDFGGVTSKDGFRTQQLIVEIFKEAGIFEYIKSIVDPRKIFDNYFKSINPFGLKEETSEEVVEATESL
jgi:hypothetical protein